ncbi:putative GntR family transcriptional regulator [Gordonia effusa NBRC 100432]|uniref:Putative GntR family transcriptional regulator n=1 Tax=Gordonia effusa NBRC 100432 TaxID=1077974 RepID=H0QVD7_9ACTN|nr:GntR family transcriptional regulator [Gordonia effusa]GAB16788.1 putative GntR family transcriptional regulator [Gordonia effusa NBRC 100432]
MDIQPIERTAVSDEVLGKLVAEILSGRIAPGDPLPAERELALRFGVNRHAIREALKGVRQAGLIRIAQGGKTRVLDWRRHAGLDVLTALAATGAVPPVELLRDIVEMRRSVATDAARLCAARASEAQRAAIVEAARGYPVADATIAATVAADEVFWTAVIDGSGNLAYRLGLNTLLSGFDAIGIGALADLGLMAEFVDRAAHLELADRIAARDADGAARLADDLLGRIVTLLAGADER